MAQHSRTKRKPLPVPDVVSVDGIGILVGADLGPGGLGKLALCPRQYGGRPGALIFCSSDRSLHGRVLHVSISYDNREPTWGELKALRAAFFPCNVDVAMILPREGTYVNFATNSFHLWEIPGEWGIGKDGMI